MVAEEQLRLVVGVVEAVLAVLGLVPALQLLLVQLTPLLSVVAGQEHQHLQLLLPKVGRQHLALLLLRVVVMAEPLVQHLVEVVGRVVGVVMLPQRNQEVLETPLQHPQVKETTVEVRVEMAPAITVAEVVVQVRLVEAEQVLQPVLVEMGQPLQFQVRP